MAAVLDFKCRKERRTQDANGLSDREVDEITREFHF